MELGGKHAEQQLETQPDAEMDEKGGHWRAREGGGKDADTDVAGGHAQESQVSQPDRPVVDTAQTGQGHVIREGEYQCYQSDDEI